MLLRQWRLIEALHGKTRGVTAPALTEELSTSRATLYRDLAVLTEVGIPIARDVVNGETRYRLLGAGLPALAPTAMQFAALLVARELAAPLEGTSLVRELDGLLHNQVGKAGKAAKSRVTIKASPSTQMTKALEVIDQAMARGKQLSFMYRAASKGDEKASLRTVDAVALRMVDSQVYLVAFDHARADWRTFKVVRMSSPALLDAAASTHEGFDEAALFAHSVKAWSSDPIEVKVRLSKKVGWLAGEWPLIAGQELETRADGSVIVRARVSGIVEAMRWVLSWGREAEALEPYALRAVLREELAMALGPYARMPVSVREAARPLAMARHKA